MNEKKPITIIQRDTELDFTGDDVRSVWIQMENPSEVIGAGSLLFAGEDETLKNQILSLIASANEVIFIGTTNLSHPEIVEGLLKAASRGVRVYIHIDSTGFDRMRDDATARSLAGPCLVRERIAFSGINCIICDGNEMDAAGLLLTAPLDSNLTAEKSGWSLQLNKNQIDELERRYTYDFWSNAKGREILAEEEVDDPPMISDRPYSIYPINNGDVLAMASLCTGDPTSNAAKRIQNADMKSVIAFEDMPTTPFGSMVFDLLSKQSEVIVNSPFTVTGETASFIAHSGLQLHVAIGTKVSVIAGWDRSASSTWGSMLILDEIQSQDIQKIFNMARESPEWCYLKKCPVGDLSEEIWFNGKQQRVLKQVDVDLGIIEVSAVDPELIAKDLPDLPRGEEMVCKVKYTWVSSPPLAPVNAKPDPLITSWVESTNSVATELSGLDERKPKTSMFGFKGKAKDIEKRISAATDIIIGISTKTDLSILVDEVNEITSLVDETSSEIMKAEQEALDDKEKEEQKSAWEQLVSKAKNRATGLAPRLDDKKKIIVTMKKTLKKAKGVEEKKIGSDIESLTREISTLVQEHQDAIYISNKKFEFVPPSKSFKPGRKSKSAKGHKFVSQNHSTPQFKVNIPEEDLPSVGTLLCTDGKRYLAISFVEDISVGTKEAKRLGAILCCPREVLG